MRVNYQMLGFDKKKTARAVQEYPIDALIIGDASCLPRNLGFGTIGLHSLMDGCKKKGVKLIYQLPLITKESEMQDLIRLMGKIRFLDGFITGDLGVISLLSKDFAKGKELIYTTNVLNPVFSEYLTRFRITQIRPLMFKRVFIEEDVGFPKDVVIYGNMMLNCATFCFHSGDRVEECRLGCAKSKSVVMRDERVFLIGRSLVTKKRLDLIPRLPRIAGSTSVTIMDHDLKKDEVLSAISRVRRWKG